MAAARTAWQLTQAAVAPADRVFFDERGVATDLERHYGRAPGGHRAARPLPPGR